MKLLERTTSGDRLSVSGCGCQGWRGQRVIVCRRHWWSERRRLLGFRA